MASVAEAAVNLQEWGPTVMAGYEHGLILEGYTFLFSWGYNGYGQLGTGAMGGIRTSPDYTVLSNNRMRHTAYSGRSDHGFVVTYDGKLLGWGRNNFGQVGLGHTTNTHTPTQVGSSAHWRTVAAGRHHTLAIKIDGSLWAWGYNASGQLGDGTKTNRNVPTAITIPGEPANEVGHWVAVSAGENFSLALKSTGVLYAWGNGANGRLGLGNTSEKLRPTKMTSHRNFVRIGAGFNSSIALMHDGKVYTWGGNGNGQLGRNGTAESYAPASIGGLTYREISIGNNFCHAIRSDGSMHAWGKNDQGQLGDNTTTQRITPVTVYGGSRSWVKVVAGDRYAIGIRAEGDAYAWGNNSMGQLGIGNTVNQLQPRKYVGPSAVLPGMVSAGNYQSGAIKANGTLWTWGSNENGLAGHGSATHVMTPAKPSTANNWTHLASGVRHNLAVRADGTLWGWGWNDYGQLADGTGGSKNVPTQITSANVAAGCLMAAVGGYGTSYVIKSDGTLWAWGLNDRGQVGDNTQTTGPTPRNIGTSKRWVYVAAGFAYAVALASDGTLWAWGDNYDGQVGDNSGVMRLAPVQVKIDPASSAADQKWMSVSAGYYHVHALRADGGLWSWGGLYAGSGMPEYNYKPKAIDFDGSSGFDQLLCGPISAGNSYTISTNRLGHAFVWGGGGEGQFGSGFTDTFLYPQWHWADYLRSVSAGGGHSLMLSGGAIYGSGRNSNYQLGNGTTNPTAYWQFIGTATY